LTDIFSKWWAPKPAGKNNQVIWIDKEDGTRERTFCMICCQEGREWSTPKLCEHIPTDKGMEVTIKSLSPESADQKKNGNAPADAERPL